MAYFFHQDQWIIIIIQSHDNISVLADVLSFDQVSLKTVHMFLFIRADKSTNQTKKWMDKQTKTHKQAY